VPFNNVVGGDGVSIYQYTNLTAPVDRNVATGLFTYNLTDHTTMNVDVSWGKVDTTNVTGALNDQLDTIHPDNAYVLMNPGLQAAVSPVFGGSLNKDWTSQLDSKTRVTTDVKRIAIGFDGAFGDSSWTWDTYYQYGNTDREQLVADNRHLNAYLMAVDSVLGPNGQPECRVTRRPRPVPASAATRTAERTLCSSTRSGARSASGCARRSKGEVVGVSRAASPRCGPFLARARRPPEPRRRARRALDERAELLVRDARIDPAQAGKRAEAAVRACEHALAPHDVGELDELLRDQLGVLDVVRRRRDAARDQDLVVGQMRVAPHGPLVPMSRVRGLEQNARGLRSQHDRQDLLERDVVVMRSFVVAPANV